MANNQVFAIKNNISKILIYTTSLCVIANGACMWELTIGSPLYGVKLGVALMVLCSVQVLINGEIATNSESIFSFFVICIMMICYCMATRYNTKLFITTVFLQFVVLFFYACSLYAKDQARSLFSSYLNLILIISVISLFFWALGSIADIIPYCKQQEYFWADRYNTTYSWYGLYYENPIQNIGQRIVRNMGIFAEAPAFSGHLIYASIIEGTFYYEDKRQHSKFDQNIKHYCKMAILFLAMLSTLSTKGIIAIGLICGLMLLFMECRDRIDMVIKLFVVIAAACLTIAVSVLLIAQKSGTGSGMMRIDDFQSCIKAWKASPIFGVGYQNTEAIKKYWVVTRDNDGLSMGLTVLLAYGGLCLTSVYACAAIRSRKIKYFLMNRKGWIIVICLLFYNLVISNMAFSNIYIFLVAAAFAAKTESREAFAFEAVKNTGLKS